MQVGAIGRAKPTGALGVAVIRGVPARALKWGEFWNLASPTVRGLDGEVRAWRRRQFPKVLGQYLKVRTVMKAGEMMGVSTAHSHLVVAKVHGDGRVQQFGIGSFRVVTTVAVNAFRDAFLNTFELETFKYHGIGTDDTPGEAVGDTALQLELTTEYTGDVRATGSQVSGGTGAYQTVGTNTLDSGTPTIVEHGIFTQAATGGGSLLDRSTFAGIALVGANGDGLQTTYTITFSAGG